LGITVRSTLILSDITSEVHTIIIFIFTDLQTMSHHPVSGYVHNLPSRKIIYYWHHWFTGYHY